MAPNTTHAGLVVVAKPAGLTSHDVVSRLRRLLATRRIGHAGTLDPMATGVLVCGVERATKLLGHLDLEPKVYLATIRLGAATSTDDAEGDVVRTSGLTADDERITEPAVRAALARQTGELLQVPSTVSAVKVGGRRAYQLARAGEQVVLEPRPVTVHRFDLVAARGVELDVEVECSGGTYVRALARDVGDELGVGGHLTSLRRTRVGQFGLAIARGLDELADDPSLSLGLDEAVGTAFTRRGVADPQARSLAHGGTIPAAGIPGTYGAFDSDGRAVALLREQGARARPVLVLRPAG